MREGGETHSYPKDVEEWQNAQDYVLACDVQIFFPPVNIRKVITRSITGCILITDAVNIIYLFVSPVSCPFMVTPSKAVDIEKASPVCPIQDSLTIRLWESSTA